MTSFIENRALLPSATITQIRETLVPELRRFTARDPQNQRSLRSWLRQHFPEIDKHNSDPRGGGSDQAHSSATTGPRP